MVFAKLNIYFIDEFIVFCISLVRGRSNGFLFWTHCNFTCLLQKVVSALESAKPHMNLETSQDLFRSRDASYYCSICLHSLFWTNQD